MKADLHLHTYLSDGSHAPMEVCEMAKERGLDIIALTDHDTYFDHSDINIEGLRIIKGVEVSSYINGESIHILAYFNNNPPKAFTSYLDNVKEKRLSRAHKIVDLLEEHFNIVLKRDFINKSNSITRGEIFREMKRQGYDYSGAYVFSTMLGEDCPCYVPVSEVTPKEILDLIKTNNGLAVLAHPMLYRQENLDKVIGLGFDGMECKYPHQKEKFAKFRDLAKKYNMFITAGSDFHALSEVGTEGDKHGNVGDVYISGRELDIFLNKLEERG